MPSHRRYHIAAPHRTGILSAWLGEDDMKKYLIGAVAMMLVSGAASAQNLVKNGGFEATTLKSSQQFTTQVTDWTNAATAGYTGFGYNFLVTPNSADSTGFRSLGNNLDYIYGPQGKARPGYPAGSNFSANGFTGTSPTGGNFILADGDTNFHGAISQTIGGLTAGNTYTVTFDWAGTTWFTTPGETTQRFDVSLGNIVKQTETLVTPAKGFSGWKQASLDFVAGGTSETLSFLAQGTPNGLPPSLLLDNVSLTAAVPEPGTWMTMMLGFGVVGAAMRRRKTATPQLV